MVPGLLFLTVGALSLVPVAVLPSLLFFLRFWLIVFEEEKLSLLLLKTSQIHYFLIRSISFSVRFTQRSASFLNAAPKKKEMLFFVDGEGSHAPPLLLRCNLQFDNFRERS